MKALYALLFMLCLVFRANATDMIEKEYRRKVGLARQEFETKVRRYKSEAVKKYQVLIRQRQRQGLYDEASLLKQKLQQLEEGKMIDEEATSSHVPSLPVSPGKALSARWRNPLGGKLQDGEAIALTGPGEGHTQSAIAVMDSSLPAEYVVSGMIRWQGNHPGVIFCYDKREESFISCYSSGKSSEIWLHEGKNRKKIGNAQLHWESAGNGWVKFQLSKKGDKVSLQIGKNKADITLPKKTSGNRWGTILFGQGTVSVKELSLN